MARVLSRCESLLCLLCHTPTAQYKLYLLSTAYCLRLAAYYLVPTATSDVLLPTHVLPAVYYVLLDTCCLLRTTYDPNGAP